MFAFLRVIVAVLCAVSLFVHPVDGIICNNGIKVAWNGKPWDFGAGDCAGVFCAYVNGTANVTISQSPTSFTAAGASCYPPNIMPAIIAKPINDLILDTVTPYLPPIPKIPRAVALALNFHGQKGRVMLCSTDNCNSENDAHYEETDSLMTSMEKATESFGQTSQNLKCIHGDKEESIDCKGGFCMMGRSVMGENTTNFRGCFNKMPDGMALITQAYAGIKQASGLESSVDSAIDSLKGGIFKRDILNFEFGVNELRGVTGDSGIAAATIYLNDTKIIFIGAYCSADNCNGKELAKSFDAIESHLENTSGSMFGSCLAIMTVMLFLVDL